MAKAIDVRYFSWPGQGLGEHFEAIGKVIETPYCGVIANNDFLLTPGIDAGINFAGKPLSFRGARTRCARRCRG